jgi:protein-disulfide isomerase
MRTPLLIIVLLALLVTSCNLYKKKKAVSEKSDQIASIDSIPISFDEVDNLCRQELFDQLSRIHLIRKITLEQVIKDKVLQLEAKRLNISVEQLTHSLYKNKITSANLEKFAILTNHTEKVTELRETLVFHDVKSPKGQEILTTRYKEYILNQYIDSLKKLHQITISLKPPKSPKMTIDNLIVHYQGSVNSKVTFLIISDFDCSMCREENPIFGKMYSEYKDKVRFGFTHYSSYVSNSAIASECASNQGKFWEMHDSIFKPKLIPDSVALFRMAKNLKLDMNTFGKDFKNKSISAKIKDNLLKLESAGIYGTPTIMINDRLIFNSTSINEIEKMLKEEIAKEE